MIQFSVMTGVWYVAAGGGERGREVFIEKKKIKKEYNPIGSNTPLVNYGIP